MGEVCQQSTLLTPVAVQEALARPRLWWTLWLPGRWHSACEVNMGGGAVHYVAETMAFLVNILTYLNKGNTTKWVK